MISSSLDRPVWSMAISFLVSAYSLGYTVLSLSRNATGALSLFGASGSSSGEIGDEEDDGSVLTFLLLPIIFNNPSSTYLLINFKTFYPTTTLLTL